MAYNLYTELHDTLSSPKQASPWPEWADLQRMQQSADLGVHVSAGATSAGSATARALHHAQASLAEATAQANQAALWAALDTVILNQATAASQTATQRAESCTYRVSRARRAYELGCALSGPASTTALVALTAFRQACSDATAAGGAAACAIESFNRASAGATAANLTARRAAALETAAMAARNHALKADLAARGEAGGTDMRSPTSKRRLQPCPRLLDNPGLVSEVARSQGFCRSLDNRLQPAA